MVYCNLKGGLANIMFQVAASHHISFIKETDCYFLNFSQILLNLKNYYKNSYTDEYRLFLPLKEGFPTNQLKTYFYPFHYDNFLPTEENFIIDGFFQSEKYFLKSKNKILNLFKIPENIENYINKNYSSILGEETVSIHVRRGDYLRFPDHHPVQTQEYYKQAVLTIEKSKQIKNILIFSDDINWCKKELAFNKAVYIENEKDYVELFLMSKCYNNIISNSSFSWWGAWLNQNPNKLVIAPKKWFGKQINHNTKDLLPQDWISI